MRTAAGRPKEQEVMMVAGSTVEERKQYDASRQNWRAGIEDGDRQT